MDKYKGRCEPYDREFVAGYSGKAITLFACDKGYTNAEGNMSCIKTKKACPAYRTLEKKLKEGSIFSE